ncbi:hypothetical protein [Sphingobium sp. BS19]|uniref:hypothetical protein n=1 Tax=Sphingobium sp. BS19 TaxID=3018973 RepID=UPI0022ED5B8B|nr:hypothetical protein [Sphingobium sp. BS19]GLI97316.1 hypothetical protein Sbs19_11340 [Sphingobium sp. BS19]
MSDGFGSSELIAALIGSCATGLFGLIDRIRERTHKSRLVFNTLKYQTVFLCAFIRSQDYLNDATLIEKQAESDDWDGGLLTISAQANYLDIYETFRADIGVLNEQHARKILEFYNRAKLFLDSTNPSPQYLSNSTIFDKRSHATETAENIRALLALGDEIEQFER